VLERHLKVWRQVVNVIEFPFILATAGLAGVSGLALLMGTALSSLAELLTLLPGRASWLGHGARLRGHDIQGPGARRRQTGALLTAILSGEDGANRLTGA
jgi:hypothetical protein